MKKPSREALLQMSKEEKLKYLDALREKRRRKASELKKYTPNSGQLRVHQSEALERYVFFGNGSGKSSCLVNEVYWAATGYNPITKEYYKVPSVSIVVLDDAEKVEMTFMPELRRWYDVPDKWCSKEGKPNISIINFPNGSTVKFLTHGVAEMKLEGIQLQNLFFDEPPPRHMYNALTRGMRKKDGSKKRTLLVGTPLAEPWLRTEVFDPWKKGELPYVECFTGSSDMNKENIDWERQEQWLARLSPAERKARMEGQFLDLSGAALAHLWRPEKHIIKPFSWPRNWPCVIAIDPAQSKNHVAVLCGAGPNNKLYYIKELSLRAPARDFAMELLEWSKGYPIFDIVCDSLGNSGQSGGEGLASFIDVINDAGVRARPTTYADKDDERWITGIQEALYCDDKVKPMPQLQIFEGNFGIVSDIENVQWIKIKHTESFRPKLDISKKDYLACLKYILASNPMYNGHQGSSASPKMRSYASGAVGLRARGI